MFGDEPATEGKVGKSFGEMGAALGAGWWDDLQRCKFPIYWFVFQDEDGKDQGGVAVCGYSMKPAFLGGGTEGMGAIRMFIVNDLFVTKTEGCEEAKRCLCLECPLNHTTLETYNRAFRRRMSQKDFDGYVQLLKKAQADIPGKYEVKPHTAVIVPVVRRERRP